MDVNEIRREKTRRLARQLTGDRESGFREIADKMDWSQSLTSQMLGSNANRKITDKRAREIESKFGKPHGWLDRQERESAPGNDLDEELLLQCLQEVRREIARLGLNLTPEDADELEIRSAIVLYRFSREAGKVLPAHIAITTARR